MTGIRLNIESVVLALSQTFLCAWTHYLSLLPVIRDPLITLHIYTLTLEYRKHITTDSWSLVFVLDSVDRENKRRTKRAATVIWSDKHIYYQQQNTRSSCENTTGHKFDSIQQKIVSHPATSYRLPVTQFSQDLSPASYSNNFNNSIRNSSYSYFHFPSSIFDPLCIYEYKFTK